MPPKKKVKKPPEYQTGEELKEFGVQAGQLVQNGLGCIGNVLGLRAAAGGGPLQLWARFAGGLEAPLEAGSFQPCPAADQLRSDIGVRQKEQAALDAKWQTHNAAQARKETEAAKAAARRRKKKAEAAAAEQQPQGN